MVYTVRGTVAEFLNDYWCENRMNYCTTEDVVVESLKLPRRLVTVDLGCFRCYHRCVFVLLHCIGRLCRSLVCCVCVKNFSFSLRTCFPFVFYGFDRCYIIHFCLVLVAYIVQHCSNMLHY